MIKWFIRLVLAVVIAAAAWLVLHRHDVLHGVKAATKRVDKTVGRAEDKIEAVQEGKEDIQDAVEDAKDRVVN